MLHSALERQRRILDILGGRESARNADLARHLKVTAMTLWRDLVELEEKGLVRRTRGRVSRSEVTVIEPDFLAKADVAAGAKSRIAAYAARHLIQTGDSLALDGGTTVAAIARETLPADLTILTNSLHTARLFMNHPARPAVYACGGLLREKSGTFIGREALSFFNRRRTARYFLSATGVDAAAGVTDLTLEDNEVKRAMASGSAEVVLLADRGKFGVVSLMRVLPWRRIHRLVTDAPTGLLKSFRTANSGLLIHRV
ncbi:MAG: DeoR/GlpR family DNA-binding transcription regulator [Terrimicrobiaceae bacterium]